MQTDYIHIILADDDEDDRLFFTVCLQTNLDILQ